MAKIYNVFGSVTKEFDTETRRSKVVHAVAFGALGSTLPALAGGTMNRKDPSERPAKHAPNFSERYFK